MHSNKSKLMTQVTHVTKSQVMLYTSNRTSWWKDQQNVLRKL